jgi:hypothetical protein
MEDKKLASAFNLATSPLRSSGSKNWHTALGFRELQIDPAKFAGTSQGPPVFDSIDSEQHEVAADDVIPYSPRVPSMPMSLAPVDSSALERGEEFTSRPRTQFEQNVLQSSDESGGEGVEPPGGVPNVAGDAPPSIGWWGWTTSWIRRKKAGQGPQRPARLQLETVLESPMLSEVYILPPFVYM